MSLPRSNYDPRRVFLFDFPKLKLGPKKKEIGVYAAGALFAIGWWIFLDAVILSSRSGFFLPPDGADPPLEAVPVRMSFTDWIPGLIATFGMLIVNLIDKSRLSSDGGAWGEGSTAWRARLVLFMGFALLGGGLAGSITILIIKYVLPAYPSQYIYYGIASVAQAGAIMLSSVVLWAAQMVGEDEYEYNINL